MHLLPRPRPRSGAGRVHPMILMAADLTGNHAKIAELQWPFQDPKLEVPTIYKAYVRPM